MQSKISSEGIDMDAPQLGHIQSSKVACRDEFLMHIHIQSTDDV